MQAGDKNRVVSGGSTYTSSHRQGTICVASASQHWRCLQTERHVSGQHQLPGQQDSYSQLAWKTQENSIQRSSAGTSQLHRLQNEGIHCKADNAPCCSPCGCSGEADCRTCCVSHRQPFVSASQTHNNNKKLGNCTTSLTCGTTQSSVYACAAIAS